ncbi:MAG: AraC family transcriptional regulator, partial [Clostridia bacterium]
RLSQLLQNMEGPRFFRLPTEKGNDDWVLRVPLRLAHGADALAVQFFLQIDALVREQIALQEARCLTISCVGEGDVHYLQEDGRYIRVPAPDGAQRVFSVELERYGMTIALSIAPKTLYHAVENSRRVTLLTLSLLLLAVMWAAVYFSERHSRPLRILAANYVSEQNLPGRLDELSMIGKLLDVTREENRHMRGVVADARGTLCQQALLLLFHGVLDEDETLNRMLSLNGLEVRSGGYLVAIVDAQPASIDLLSALPECELNCRMTLYHRSVLVVLLDYVEEETVRKLRSAHAARMVEACENAGLPAPRVSFSRFCPSLSQCSQAYIEAVFAYKVGLSGMAGGFLCFDELLSFDLPSAGFPAQEEETFVRALAAMDKKRVEAALQVLLTFIASDAHCDETRIALRVTLLQRAMHAFLEQDAVLDDISGMDPTDGERFEKQLGAFLRRVLSENAVDGAYERVLACIQEHYTDSQLTLAVVSQRVGLSAAYISRLFHNKGEKKYIDYLTDLRVQEAMRLLCQTNLQVKEITQRVGYWDTVNFQKKFKAITGLNPSEYRKTMQGGDPHDFGNAGDAGQGGI